MISSNTPTAHQTIATYTALAFLVASAVWLAMIIAAALQLREYEHTGSATIMFGPLHLHELSKIYTPSGYTVSLSVSADLLWYCLAWIIAGVSVGAVRARRIKNI